MFQFHKVRLKVSGDLPETVIFLFQFHKVRLKVEKNVFNGYGTEFQFHKVRLKGKTTPYAKRMESVSIP